MILVKFGTTLGLRSPSPPSSHHPKSKIQYKSQPNNNVHILLTLNHNNKKNAVDVL